MITQTITSDTIQVEEMHGIQQPDWAKNAVIYEVNIRQFSQEGTFEKVTQQLNRIKDMGVDVIWLMPIHPIGNHKRKGTLGSYYAVKDYKAVNPNYGTLEDFQNLVGKAHDLDMKVIIDWVANHSSPDNVWIKGHLDYYTKDHLGNAPIIPKDTDWEDTADLNYDNPELRSAMQEAMQYWVKEHDIDGFRCDVAEMVPLDFWLDTRAKLDSIKPVFMLAEGANPELHQAFNMTYGWTLKNTLLNIADKKMNFKAVQDYITEKEHSYKPHDIIMYFTTNHDENSWNYLETEKFGSNLKNYIALTYLMGGMPLIYSGQESGLDKQLAFFEKDTIAWDDYKYANYYKNLSDIYKTHKVLWSNGERAQYEILKANDDAFQFVMKKEDKLIAVLQNYSELPQYVSKISLNGLNIETNLIGYQPLNVSERGVEIPPHATIIIGQK